MMLSDFGRLMANPDYKVKRFAARQIAQYVYHRTEKTGTVVIKAREAYPGSLSLEEECFSRPRDPPAHLKE